MRRVLFVDDEIAVLDGLRDRLRKQRREWEMVFAQGGDAALAECARGAFDVVVSDMRMPGIDGAALLQRIKDTHPGTIRIVLSGHAEREAVMRALPVAHQYLSKPCDAETLRSVIARACALQTILSDGGLRKIVGGVERLPSVSKTYMELTQVLAGKAPSIDDVVKVVERDPAMCMKLLQVVNSAFFGLPRRVSAMRDAIAYLGIELLKSLVLAAQIFGAAEGPKGLDGALLASVQRHSILVARVARAIVPSHADDAFMAGMLHDVGRIVLALADQSGFSAIATSARERAVPSFLIEQERLGFTHAEVGAYILGSWGVPFAIVEAVAAHHEPQRLGGASFDATTAVHVAEALVPENDDDGSAGEGLLDQAYLDRVGVLGKVPAWLEIVRQIREELQG
jgi:HD-like signal output (HDOD) protein/ActR/RegA family two-component response regulator